MNFPRAFTAAFVLVLAGCAATSGDPGADNKVLVSRGAWQLMQRNDQATAVYAANADKADSELICERVLVDGYKEIRTLCYTREELEGTQRQHREAFQELTLFPGSGG